MAKIPWKGVTAVLLTLCVFCVGMTLVFDKYSHYINDFLGTVDIVIKNDNVSAASVRYKSDYFPNTVYNGAERQYTDAQAAEYMKDKLAFVEEVAGEGIVLLKNNGALPIAPNGKITCLGRASAALHYCASSGSGMIPTANAVRIDQAFAAAGATVNPTALDFYKSRKETVRTEEGGNKAAIGETPVSEYPEGVLSSFAEYGDAAVVVFTRPGGEGNDLVTTGGADFTGSQLNLNEDEKAVLALAKKHFEKVVVLLNCDNPIGIGDIKNDDGIDAIVWAGGLGINGANALARLLTGQENFSGRLPDTFATDSLSSAAAQNCGKYYYTNADEIKAYVKNDACSGFLVEAEGIYIGYKYYETRYEDHVLGGRNADCARGVYASGRGKWDYTAEIAYPFGYGLSYTSFEEQLESVVFNAEQTVATVTVGVKNTGKTTGKDVVQIWYQSPYTPYDEANGVEKSAVQLADYFKTETLAPGEEKTYTAEIAMANCASYDSDGAGTYILDAGDHYFALGNGAHDGLNNILAAKGHTVADSMDYDGDPGKTFTWHIDALDAESFATSRWTGAAIGNLFGDADLDAWIENGVTYLTRRDWTTFPQTYDRLTAPRKLIERLACNENITGVDYSGGAYAGAPDVTYDADKTEYALFMLADKKFSDPMWNDLLDQLSMRDTAMIIGIGNCETTEIRSINKQKTMGGDGPTGFAGIIAGQTFNGAKLAIRCYFSETLCSATWNKDLAYRFGKFLGEDGLFINKTDLWGPGANLHRTPFSGRNAEYPAEDGILGFEQLGAQCRGMSEKGLIAAPKHFAFNDQESNRVGLSTFVREQAAREIILRVFEGAFTEGGALGTMSSFPRIGPDYIGMSRALLHGYLRDELGFMGYITTDMAGSTDYMRPVESVKAGVTLFDNNSTTQADILYEKMRTDKTLRLAMREAAHYTLYAFANSNAMNGYDENARIVSVIPWWQGVMIGLDVGFGVLFAASAAVYVVRIVRARREEV